LTTLVALVGAAAVALFLSGLPPVRPLRLSARIDPYLSGLHGKPSVLLNTPQGAGPVAFARRLVATVAARLPGNELHLALRLREAGQERDAAGFRLEQVIWGLAACLLVWVVTALAAFTGVDLDARVLPPLTALAFLSGCAARDWRLTRQIEARRARLEEELPTAIDLMALSILAGESVPAAFARVAGSLRGGMGAELRGVVGDIRAGATTIEALEAFKRRVPLAAVARLVDALITGIERGSPLADVLRAQAEDGREARRRSLLEIAGRREVLMLVPVVFLVMPVVVVFTLFPGLVALDLLVP
jgi:tight adherence protein C